MVKHFWGRVLIAAYISFGFSRPCMSQDTNPKWKTQLGGYAGTLVISGERGVIGTHTENLKFAQLHCVNLTNGQICWSANIPRLKSIWQDNPSSPLRSVPAIKDGRVVAYTNRGQIVCFDLEGTLDGKNNGVDVDWETNNVDVIWQRDLIEEFGVFKRSSIGFGIPEPSPLIVENRVYCATGNGSTQDIERFFDNELKVPAPNAPSVVCLDLDDGKLIWSNNQFSKQVQHSSVASPTRIVDENSLSTLFYVAGDGKAYCLSESDGRVLWSSNEEQFLWSWTSPVVSDGKIVICNSAPPSSTMTHDSLGIVCYRTEDSFENEEKEPIWIFQDEAYRGTYVSPVFHNGVIFVLTDTAFLIAIDSSNGKLLWKEEIDYSVMDFPELKVVGEYLMVPVAFGVECYFAGRTKKRIAYTELNFLLQSRLEYLDDVLFVASPRALNAFPVKSLFPELFRNK